MLFIFILSKVSASNQTLIIYTYDSFAAEWGPGPAIETAFEKKCECEVEFVATSNAGTLLTKIKLEGANSCLLYTSPSPRDGLLSRMPSSA